MFTVPRLLRSAVIVRGPLALLTLMTPDAALVNVPVVTMRVSAYPSVVVESSRISPELVKPVAAVRLALVPLMASTMTISPAGMLPPRVLAPCTWNTVPLPAAALLFRVEFKRTGDPVTVPPFRLSVTELKAGDALSVPPFRLNVPELKAPDPVSVPPLKLNVAEGRLSWDVAGIANVPAL